MIISAKINMMVSKIQVNIMGNKVVRMNIIFQKKHEY